MEPLKINIMSTPKKGGLGIHDQGARRKHNAPEPIIEYASQCLQLLSSLLIFTAAKSRIIVAQLACSGFFVAQQTVMASRSVLANTAQLSQNATLAVWESSQVRRLRKKLELEFFTFILGCGNVLCVMMFWPGWWLLALAVIVTCYTCAG